ncbi:hypothetical protein N0V90_013245 [Kalmusia sp. IMI 367209]|nr:hypothetical protein N0V90_013245 [Kalmusia sp. IMI 367209]
MVYLNFCLFSLFMLSSGNGYDGSMLNGLLALPQWNEFMDKPTGAWLGFIAGSTNVGSIVCFPIVAWGSNKYGRKSTIFMGYFFIILGVGLQTAAINYVMFVIARITMGFASAFFGGCVPLLMTETAYPTHRGIVTSLYFCGWYVVERHEEARAFLVKYHAEGDESSALAAFEFAEISRSIQMEREFQKSTSYKQMLATPANRKRTFITVFLGIFNQWAGQNVAGYYLPLVLTSIGIETVTQQTLINGFLQIWNLICALTGAFNVDRVGRRSLFLSATAGMFVSYILITALSATFAKGGSAAVGTTVVPFLFLMYGCFSLAFTPLLVAYPVEIWPYQLRSRGLATMWISTATAVFFNIFVNPIALESIQWRYYLVYVFILAGGGLVIYFAFPETRGHSLEEMACLFGDDNIKNSVEGEISEKIGANSTSYHVEEVKPTPQKTA